MVVLGHSNFINAVYKCMNNAMSCRERTRSADGFTYYLDSSKKKF